MRLFASSPIPHKPEKFRDESNRDKTAGQVEDGLVALLITGNGQEEERMCGS
jgi:hypothetical protein